MSLRPPGPPPTLAEVRDTVAAILSRPASEVPEDADLLELGLDSLGMLRVMNLWRKAGIRIGVEDFTSEPTLAAWARHTRPAAQEPTQQHSR